MEKSPTHFHLPEGFWHPASQWDTRVLATDISQQALSKAGPASTSHPLICLMPGSSDISSGGDGGSTVSPSPIRDNGYSVPSI